LRAAQCDDTFFGRTCTCFVCHDDTPSLIKDQRSKQLC
jgi:hypothetical protein